MENSSQNAQIGHVLRAAREAQSASLDDISALLKIRSDHLEALENDDYDRLPGHVYAIGFIRTYATHLDLNAAELVSLFKEATMVSPLDEGGYNDAGAGEPLSLGLKLGLGVFAVFLVYLMWLIAGGASTQNDTTQNQNGQSESAQSQVEAPVVEAPALVKAPEIVPAPKAAAPAPVQEAVQTPSQVGEPAQGIGDPESISVTRLDAPQAEVISEPIAPQVVAIKASRRTWMRIENMDGRVLFSSIIREGEGFELQDDTPYTLATRDAGALHYHVDDARVGNVGRRGQILTAREIDRAAIIALKP